MAGLRPAAMLLAAAAAAAAVGASDACAANSCVNDISLLQTTSQLQRVVATRVEPAKENLTSAASANASGISPKPVNASAISLIQERADPVEPSKMTMDQSKLPDQTRHESHKTVTADWHGEYPPWNPGPLAQEKQVQSHASHAAAPALVVLLVTALTGSF